MSFETESTEESPAEDSNTPKEKKSLGKLLASRATDLIAIAIIIVVALTVGRRLANWWSVDEAALKNPFQGASMSSQWGGDGKPVRIQFGDSKTPFQRTDITGTKDELTSRLVELTILKIQELAPESQAVSESELEILNYISKLTPFKSISLKEEVYLVGGPAPVIWGVKKESLDAQPRVVCWGTCLSQGENHWAFYLSSFGSVDQSSDETNLKLSEPIQMILSLQNQDGGSMLSFKSLENVDGSKKRLSEDLQEQGWKMSEKWSTNSNGFTSAVFLKFVEEDQKIIRADVQLKLQNDELSSGMIVTSVSKIKKEK